MQRPFELALARMNKIKSIAHFAYMGLSVLRAMAVALVVTALWMDVAPATPLLHMLIGIVTFFAVIRFSSFGRTHKIKQEAMYLAMDMQHPGTSMSPFQAAKLQQGIEEWEPRLVREEKRLRAWEYRRLITMAGSSLVPMLVAFLLITKTPFDVSSALIGARNVISALTGGVNLQIISGAATNEHTKQGDTVSLSVSGHPTIELVPENMLRLSIAKMDSNHQPPVVILQGLRDSVPLSMQMSAESSQGDAGSVWVLEFSAPYDAELVIPDVSSKPVALLKVREMPIPKVQMTLAGEPRDPWPDQDAVPLSIKVQSVYALDKVRLRVVANGKNFQESVLNITGDTTEVNTTYNLSLQPWMEEDIVEFSIVAEAVDRADPKPLIGVSAPLHLKVASAYGRYRAVLEKLRLIKSTVDDARSAGKTVQEEIVKHMDEALQRSLDTPFFDGLDRVELTRLRQMVAEVAARANTNNTQELAEDLGKFLFEHEILDDRERDRDFFIAIRSYSRVLDRPTNDRMASSKYLSDKMLQFLNERARRWAARAQRLGPAFESSMWSRVSREKPFHQAVINAHRDAELSPKSSQGTLSKLASEYKTWIDELEAKEDQARAKQDQERQQGIANARNELREIQQRQDQISANLDRFSSKSEDTMTQLWSNSRTLENSNIIQASSLLSKLRGMSPKAGERLEAAIAAMSQASEAGEQKDWSTAETASDIAGRLLRDADHAASKSQSQRERGRRRRTGGDDYHGNSIGGQVEIKSEYHVDPKYREEILRDVDQEEASGANRNLLDGWLRQIVR